MSPRVALLLIAVYTVGYFTELSEQLSSMASTVASLLSAVSIVGQFTELSEQVPFMASTMLYLLSYMASTLHKTTGTAIKYGFYSGFLTKSSFYCGILH
jgi:hypothetical protein